MYLSDFAISVFVLAVLSVIGLTTWLVALPKMRARRLAVLKSSQTRLQGVVGELMEKANNLDLLLEYADKGNRAALTGKLKVALDDLLMVADTLPTIDQLLKEKRIDDSADMLSASCRLADKAASLLSEVKSATDTKTPGLRDTESGIIDVEIV
ncbi:MAG: hypothetical protein K8F91_10455 [Candidatus Obscuribacterales bacterium]|nr:hypothetical protein [Candidatus Obscuribacterales bacterium]